MKKTENQKKQEQILFRTSVSSSGAVCRHYGYVAQSPDEVSNYEQLVYEFANNLEKHHTEFGSTPL